MLALHDWQQQMQHAILTGEASDALRQALRHQGVIPAQRIGIYQDAYRLRLTEALQSNYPALALYLGEHAFDDMATQYIAAQPSRHPSIRWFGDRLARFLAHASPWTGNGVLHELAAFEWALRHTVDAAEEPVLALQTVIELPAADWPALQLRLQPSVTLLPLDFNTPLIWKSLMEQQTLPQVQAHPQSWLVYRRHDFMAMWRSADALEACLLALANTGCSFADVCEVIAQYTQDAEKTPARAAEYLRGWVESDLLQDTTSQDNG